MENKRVLAFALTAVSSLAAAAVPSIAAGETIGPCTEARQSIYFARAAEKRGDVDAAAQLYLTAISMLESSAPRDLDLSKVVLCDEPVPSIGRRMVYYQIKLLEKELAKSERTISIDHLLKNIAGTYGKMAWIERKNPTWPYLEAVAFAADRNYRQAYIKCREAALAPGGDESVRQKARSLAEHIKSGALQQEQMKYEDQAAYEQYVRSGAQSLDFAMVSARCSADDARKRGDTAAADMWERRYSDYSQQRSQLK